MLKKFISFLKKKNTLQKFISFLKKKNIKFEKSDEKIIINHDGFVDLGSLTSLPEGIIFNNGGGVHLNFLTSLPEDISFNNGGTIYLYSLTTLPKNIKFNNGGGVHLNSLTSLPKGISFNNGGDIDLRSLKTLPEDISFNNGGDIFLSYLTSLSESITFNNGGDIFLKSLTSLSESITFNNGGDVYLKSKVLTSNKKYITRFKIKVKNNSIILYKKVSFDFKTQENTKNETVWKIGSKVVHPDWQPELKECGEGKFHACAKPHWCDVFRDKKGDRYIAIKVSINNLHEWKDNPHYPQKIGFRKGVVLYECDRNGNPLY